MAAQHRPYLLGALCGSVLLLGVALQGSLLLGARSFAHASLGLAFVVAAGSAALLLGLPWLARRFRGGRPAVNLAAPAADADIARLSAVTRRYGAIAALDGVDLRLKAGELLAVLGPNGAGKSSAIALLLGLNTPDVGTAMLLGGSPQQICRRRGIGVMMQDVTLAYGMRVRELIAQTASYYPHALGVQETLTLTQTGALADRIYEKLSGGQKRQVQFALAVCGRPAVLFLDEPTVGLDIAAREHLWATVRQLRAAGTSILLTTHYLEEAEALADRVVVLAAGRVVAAGTVADMRSVVSRRQIRCDSGLQAEELARWPGVVSVQRAQQTLTILATDAEAVLRRLLQEDQKVTNLEVQRPGLAEAFVELTKEAA